MAPSTAVLFLLFDIALILRSKNRVAAETRFLATGRVLGAAATLVAMVLLPISLSGQRLELEHLYVSITEKRAGFHIAHMSPAEATGFVLFGIAFLLVHLTQTGRRIYHAVALAIASLLLCLSVVFLLAYLYGRPLLYSGTMIPPALNTAAAFALLNYSLIVQINDDTGTGVSNVQSSNRHFAKLLFGFILLSTTLIISGYLYHAAYEKQYRTEIENGLQAVLNLKVADLTKWRRERIGNGSVFFSNTVFTNQVRGFLRDPENPSNRRDMETWLRRLRSAYLYKRVSLFSAYGDEVAAVPDTPMAACSQIRSAVRTVFQSRNVKILDFHRTRPDGEIHLSVLVPIFDPETPSVPLGALRLLIDPSTYLYPLIERWPASSLTAETILVQRSGSDALFLNELRFRKNAALRLRIPLTSKQVPAVRAVTGFAGIVDGIDYRGAHVVAAVGPVPDSPWFMVARMDSEEVYAGLRMRFWMLVVMITGFLIAAAGWFGYMLRIDAMRQYQSQLSITEALTRSEMELKERNEEMSRFTYTVSHDLKSPLVTIQTFLGYLEKDLSKKDTNAVARDLELIQSAGTKMGRLLEELLNLSRVGRKVNPPEHISLQTIVKDAMVMVAGRLTDRNASVFVTDTPVLLFCDKVRMIQVYQNLIDNSIKFMGNQIHPQVEIGVDQADTGPVLFVKDNGAGVDPRHISKMFGLFGKLDPATEGTGVGLALVQRIIEIHGGHIWAESGGLDTGTHIKFTLPNTKIPTDKEARS